MSAPTSFPQPLRVASSTESKEDCRDYLRTGRCKYGPSCKYNHPENVQTGGGMKLPPNPSDPLFPVRPNEPLCQYYMKHGTCKFGQACKFHHPPQSHMSSAILNGGVGASVGASMNASANTNANSGVGVGVGVGTGGRRNENLQVSWHGGLSGEDSNIQLLPQRPGEPNCLFFLKNGRCKYGSSCRYHHPMNQYERGVADTLKRQQQQQQQQHLQNSNYQGGTNKGGAKIHYVTQLPPGSYQQGHFVVTDGTVAFLTLDGSSSAQVIPVSQGNGEQVVFTSGGRPLGHTRDAASTSTPSMDSSYETAMSNSIDMMASQGESSSAIMWNNRPRRNNSSNSLGPQGGHDAIGRTMMNGGRTVYAQDGSNMHRVASASSNTSEGGSVYFDASQFNSRTAPPQFAQGTGGTAWRGYRSNSFDYSARDEDLYENTYRQHEERRSPMVRPRSQSQLGTRRRTQQGGEVDDGLSMMTSALLTMLDTPEEGAYENQQDDHSVHSSQMSTPQMRPVDAPVKVNADPTSVSMDASNGYHTNTFQQGYYDYSTGEGNVLGLLNGESKNRLHTQYQTEGFSRKPDMNTDSFLQWQRGQGSSLQENGQSLPVPQNTSTSPHNTSNVGLYLP